MFDNWRGRGPWQGSSSYWMAEQRHYLSPKWILCAVGCSQEPKKTPQLFLNFFSRPFPTQTHCSHSGCAPPRTPPADPNLAKMEEKSTKYRIISFTTSNERDRRQWFSLEIQVRASRYRITVSPSNFRNSPLRSHEFQEYFAFLRSQHNNYDDDDSFEEADEEEHASRGPTMYDCFDWAATPCLADFERLSPALRLLEDPLVKGGQRLALSHFLAAATFECDLTAANDVLAPGDIEPVETGEDMWPSPRSEDDDTWATSFPSFSATEVAVICDDTEHPFDSNPTRVFVGQQKLYFKESPDPDDEISKKEVETYERIAAANLGPEAGIRTSRLYGVVRNKRDQLVGLLLYPIEEDTPLTFAIGPETPGTSKDRWAQQIQDTVTALHREGITWGDAKPDNILVDVHGDAWIIDFGGGRTEEWVDSDKAGTAEGDLQGLERILKFIARGGGDVDD